jgi:hypothetical protein
VLEAATNEDNLPQRLERGYFGHESQMVNAGWPLELPTSRERHARAPDAIAALA